MARVSKDFDRNEFACRCGCGYDTVDVDTVAVLQRLRDFYGSKVTITSGCRCIDHNTAIGGRPGSLHMQARGVDFTIEEISPREIHNVLLEWYPDKYGFGVYGTFNHLDTRRGPARWGKT